MGLSSAKLELALSTAQQNTKLPQNNGSNNKQIIYNNGTTTLERTAAEATGMD